MRFVSYGLFVVHFSGSCKFHYSDVNIAHLYLQPVNFDVNRQSLDSKQHTEDIAHVNNSQKAHCKQTICHEMVEEAIRIANEWRKHKLVYNLK